MENQKTQLTRKEEIMVTVNNTLYLVNISQVTVYFQEDLT